MLNRILNKTNVLEKALDATWLRNEVITQNIANVDTPGYKRKTVQFEQMLNSALEQKEIEGATSHPRHIPIGRSSIEKVPIRVTQDNASLNYRLDGNNVDIENEMAEEGKNIIQYNTLAQKLNGEFRKLKSAISEGRK